MPLFEKEKRVTSFIVAGEVSGDWIASWYLTSTRQGKESAVIEAVGGEHLKNLGIPLYLHLSLLSVVGVTEIVKKLRELYHHFSGIYKRIVFLSPDKLILVNFSTFNLLLAWFLKRANFKGEIVFLSPPQLWVWGAWRVYILKKAVDKVEVIFPFEVEFYKKYEIKVEYVGHPVLLTSNSFSKIGFGVAVLPGSRPSEIETLLPLFAQCGAYLQLAFPSLELIFCAACPSSAQLIKAFLEKTFPLLRYSITQKKEEAFKVAVALTKPGTNTLELAWQGIPSVLCYKVSRLTFALARRVVLVSHMGLANLLLKQEIYPELLQSDCKASEMAKKIFPILEEYKRQPDVYQERRAELARRIRSLFILEQ